MSSTSFLNDYERRQLYWVARDYRYSRQWVLMYDPVPGIDRSEWIGELRGPFLTWALARQACDKLNQVEGGLGV